MSEPRTEHQDDPWNGVRTFDANVRGDGYIEREYGPAIGQGDDCRPRGDCAWVDEVDAARAAVEARYAEEIAAKDRQIADAQEWSDLVTRGQSPCGHWKAYSYCEDQRGAVIDCWQCRAEKAEADLSTLREQLAAVQQERDEKAAMHNELATLAGSAIVLATLDTLAGERPTQEPEHALPAAVWRLVQERDEARAANTANLREMVGMAGRFRQTLQTVRACIVALTPGHRTGYDWNADPLYLTRKEGEALSAIDAELSRASEEGEQLAAEAQP